MFQVVKKGRRANLSSSTELNSFEDIGNATGQDANQASEAYGYSEVSVLISSKY